METDPDETFFDSHGRKAACGRFWNKNITWQTQPSESFAMTEQI